jgi:GTP diphosphokinase / guanosine-3',5'-bis(diphosphate) 3'-diphosphatase
MTEEKSVGCSYALFIFQTGGNLKVTRQRFFTPLKEHFKDPEQLRQLQIAYWLAKTEHRPQKRDSGERYFEHVRDVCLILIELGVVDTTALTLAFLHDLLEDCWTPEDVLFRLFGPDIYEGAKVLSKRWFSTDLVTGRMERHKRTEEDYYRGIAGARREPRLVKLADRIHNLRSCGVWSPEKRLDYVEETRKYLLPIARETDPRFYAALVDLCDRIEVEVGAAVL